MMIFALLYVNSQNFVKKQKEVHKQITDTQDQIKSLNSELSKWQNAENMTLEAKKLKLRKAEIGEIVILEGENDS